LRDRGIHLTLLIEDQPDMVGIIKRIDPLARIYYRWVGSDHDPNPASVGWPSGEEWFNRLWPHQSEGQGADVHVFVNEWINNDWPVDAVKRFNDFYVELMEANTKRGLICTCADLSTGVLGTEIDVGHEYMVRACQPMLETAQRLGHYLNYHWYDYPDPNNPGHLYDPQWTILCWKYIIAGFPRIKVMSGEMANWKKDGLAGPETPSWMQQYYGMVKDEEQYETGCWWLVCDPEVNKNPGSDWSKDDITGYLPWYFAWAATQSSQ
jgi:hypothetical protein